MIDRRRRPVRWAAACAFCVSLCFVLCTEPGHHGLLCAMAMPQSAEGAPALGRLTDLPQPVLEKCLLACDPDSRRAAAATCTTLLSTLCNSPEMSGTVVLHLGKALSADEPQRQALACALRRRAAAIHSAVLHYSCPNITGYMREDLLSRLMATNAEESQLGADWLLGLLPPGLSLLRLPDFASKPLLSGVQRFTRLQALGLPYRAASRKPEVGLDWDAAPAAFSACAGSLRRLAIAVCCGGHQPEQPFGEYTGADDLPPQLATAVPLLTCLESLTLKHAAFSPELTALLEALQELPRLSHLALGVFLEEPDDGANLSRTLAELAPPVTCLELSLQGPRGRGWTQAGPLSALPLRWLSVHPMVALHPDIYRCEQLAYLQLAPEVGMPAPPADRREVTAGQLMEVYCFCPAYACGRVYYDVPAGLAAFPALQRLRIKWAYATEDFMDEFAELGPPPSLTCLELDSLRLEGWPAGLTGMSSLRRLVFDSFPFERIRPGPYLSSLEHLGLLFGDLTDASMKQLFEDLESATRLTSLDLEHTMSWEWQSPEAWAQLVAALPALRLLKVSGPVAAGVAAAIHGVNPRVQLCGA